jgi:hypothetical protein
MLHLQGRKAASTSASRCEAAAPCQQGPNPRAPLPSPLPPPDHAIALTAAYLSSHLLSRPVAILWRDTCRT